MVKFINERSEKFSLFNLIMFIRLLCGFYNDISCYKVVNFFARVYCIILYGLNFYMFKYYKEFDGFEFTVCVLFFLDYTFNSTISMYTGDKYLYNYQSDVKIIDNVMKWKSRDLRWSLFCLGIVAIKLIYMMTTKYIQTNQIDENFIHLALRHLMYVHSVSKSIVFELLWKRLWYIRQAIESGHAVEDVQRKCRTLMQISLVYKNLLSSAEIALKAIKITIPYGVVSMLFLTIVRTHRIIFDGMKTGDTSFAILNTLNIIMGMVVYCVMLFFGELVLDEFDQIKGALGYEILLCSDKTLRQLLYEIVDYMQSRPPKFTVLGVFPLTLKSVKGLIGICVTYVIMMLQFRI